MSVYSIAGLLTSSTSAVTTKKADETVGWLAADDDPTDIAELKQEQQVDSLKQAAVPTEPGKGAAIGTFFKTDHDPGSV